ncbi:DUF3256 family protein [Dysgonomonas macrotermitis]|uniref:DUF3256 family protein n=1 Tax=Dysgonomonas macrotermitis TaxID=1346286 RepID=A0A1M5CY70_9BACT|nr:DUF3256 family protein [Dysgonomonas macrotermitis]SHF59631.1 Protein of unknown function [Dysgonomonas macrotermitis]
MKKILVALLIFSLFPVLKAQNIASAVVSMPDNMLIGVTLDQKKELAVELPDSLNKEVYIINAVGDSVVRLDYSDDYIALKTSDAGILQIKLLPLVNNSSIIGVITTVCGQICDSRIDFYTTSWEPLDRDSLFPKVGRDWFFKKDIDQTSQDYLNAAAVVDMTPIKMAFSAKDKNVTAEYQLQSYLAQDDYKAVEPYLLDKPKVFEWNKFVYKEKE